MDSIAKTARKITLTLFAAQSLTWAGFIAIGTVLTILGTELSGHPTWAGVPFAVAQLASAPGAFVWGLVWDRIGRRKGLSLGIGFSLFGLTLSLVAIQMGSFTLFLFGLAGLGFARAATQLSRFIAAEVNIPAQRGRAISLVVWGGTFGAVFGPLLVAPTGIWAEAIGWNPLAGPFLVTVGLTIAAMIVTYWGLSTEPLSISRQIAAAHPEDDPAKGAARPFSALLRAPGVLVALTSMVLAQMVMIMVMGITSLHMTDIHVLLGHTTAAETLGAVSWVVSAHTIGMFAVSPLTGILLDRFGRGPVILWGAIIMLASFVLAPLLPQTLPIAAALFLLGLGWNFCYVGGSTLLTDQLSPSERARTQGTNDLFIGVVSALGGIASGPIYAAQGFGGLNLVSALFALVILALTAWWYATSRQPRKALVGSE